MAVLGEKLRWVLHDHSVGLRGGVGSTFSQEQCICPTLLMTHKRLLYTDHVRHVWSRTIHGLSMGCVWRADWVFPTGCTLIQIAVTLGYE
jgi:hypothetical protein